MVAIKILCKHIVFEQANTMVVHNIDKLNYYDGDRRLSANFKHFEHLKSKILVLSRARLLFDDVLK